MKNIPIALYFVTLIILISLLTIIVYGEAVGETKEVLEVSVVPEEIIIAPEPYYLCSSDRALDMVNYAYDISGGDMRFVGTIGMESMFDPNALGDKGRSFGYCQINSRWHKERQKEYRNLKDDYEKMEYCYNVYRQYLEAGNIRNRLYGFRTWKLGVKKLNIECAPLD